MSLLKGKSKVGGTAVSKIFTVPTWVSNGTVYSASSGTSHNVPLPASLSAGDMLIVALQSLNVSFAAPAPTFATPAGWTRNVNRGLFGFGPNLQSVYVFTKISNGAEGATVTITCDVSSFVAAIGSKVTGTSGTPVNALGNASIATTTTPATPVVTSTNPNCLIVSYVMVSESTTTATQPAGFTRRFQGQDASASWDNYVGWADKTQVTAGLVTPGGWSGVSNINGNSDYGVTIAITS